MTLLLSFSTAACLLGLVLIYWMHSQYHLDIVVRTASVPPNASLISVCVPARNEEHNIAACVRAVLSQTYSPVELLVLDDNSTDSTPEILRRLRARQPTLRVLQGARLPEGWTGKPHALYQAAAAARGDWLCFVDADTLLRPEALASCLATAEETGADLFTIMTRQVTGSFWERVVMPLVMTALSVGFPPRSVNDPRRRVAVANGQFILIRRRVYEAIGGHARIHSEIVDDKALAQLVKWNGYRLIMADGTRFARTRMYTSLSQMWEGWTKNIYLGLRDQPALWLWGVLGPVLLVTAAILMPLWSLLGLYWYSRGGAFQALLVLAESLVIWGSLLVARSRVARAMSIPPWYALTTPLGCGLFAAMMLASAWKVLSRRGVTWRGRTYKPA